MSSVQECAEPPDLLPSQAAVGGPTGLGSELAPGSCRPARSGEIHRVHTGHGRAVRSQRYCTGRDLCSGKSDTRMQNKTPESTLAALSNSVCSFQWTSLAKMAATETVVHGPHLLTS